MMHLKKALHLSKFFGPFSGEKCKILNVSEKAWLLNSFMPCQLSSSANASIYNNKKGELIHKLVTPDELKQFDQAFETILSDVKTRNELRNVEDILERNQRCLKYTVQTGKKNRGLIVVAAYKALEKPDLLTEDNIMKANILGWAVEIFQAVMLVTDDVVDGSQTRRGVPCWYKNEDVGLHAITDALYLESGMYVTLKNYFSDHPAYVHLLELFRHSTIVTLFGQLLDGVDSDLDAYSMDRVNNVANYKTSHYTFQLPFAAAMFLTNKTDPEAHKQTDEILRELGRFFQAQDDFLDCFGDPEVTGKIGTDIQTGKCTWLVAKALELATPKQKEILKNNYAKDDNKCVETVKNLYKEMELPRIFKEYEEKSFNNITSNINKYSKNVPSELILKMVSTIFKRSC